MWLKCNRYLKLWTVDMTHCLSLSYYIHIHNKYNALTPSPPMNILIGGKKPIPLKYKKKKTLKCIKLSRLCRDLSNTSSNRYRANYSMELALKNN